MEYRCTHESVSGTVQSNLTVRESSKWASRYAGEMVTISNISSYKEIEAENGHNVRAFLLSIAVLD
ncbi:MAG: hypothetical protein QW062_05365 [Thermoplasmatales archaeon]